MPRDGPRTPGTCPKMDGRGSPAQRKQPHVQKAYCRRLVEFNRGKEGSKGGKECKYGKGNVLELVILKTQPRRTGAEYYDVRANL